MSTVAVRLGVAHPCLPSTRPNRRHCPSPSMPSRGRRRRRRCESWCGSAPCLPRPSAAVACCSQPTRSNGRGPRRRCCPPPYFGRVIRRVLLISSFFIFVCLAVCDNPCYSVSYTSRRSLELCFLYIYDIYLLGARLPKALSTTHPSKRPARVRTEGKSGTDASSQIIGSQRARGQLRTAPRTPPPPPSHPAPGSESSRQSGPTGRAHLRAPRAQRGQRRRFWTEVPQ